MSYTTNTEETKKRQDTSHLLRMGELGDINIFAFLFMLLSGFKDDKGSPLTSPENVTKISNLFGIEQKTVNQVISQVNEGSTSALSGANKLLESTSSNYTHSKLSQPLSAQSTSHDGPAWQEYIAHLITREGKRNDAYYDSEGYLTIGVGHKVLPEDGISYGDVISDEQVLAFLEKDAGAAFDAATRQAKEMGVNDIEVIKGLAAVNFQLGEGWTKDFYATWPAIKNGNYERAISNLDSSKWNKQTPVRVDDFQNVLRHAIEIRDGRTQAIALNEKSPLQETFANADGEKPDPKQPEPLINAFDGQGKDQVALAATTTPATQAQPQDTLVLQAPSA